MPIPKYQNIAIFILIIAVPQLNRNAITIKQRMEQDTGQRVAFRFKMATKLANQKLNDLITELNTMWNGSNDVGGGGGASGTECEEEVVQGFCKISNCQPPIT